METLISDLIVELKKFNELGRNAPKQLSKYGEEDLRDGDLPTYQKFWDTLIAQSEDRTQKIIALSKDFPEKKEEMDRPLAFYRSLSRYMAECPPVWSAYYDEIREVMGDFHDLLIDIDTQYKLGQHVND